MAGIDWKRVEELLEPIASASGAFLVGHSERRERGRRILQLLVDTDEGITIAQCAEVSRELAARLDEFNVVSEPYELELSSPGIDKPLKILRQYKKNVGRKFVVHYWEGAERRSTTGTLAELKEDRLTFVNEKGESTTLEFSNIIESIEELPW